METSVHMTPPAGELRPGALGNLIYSVDVLRGVALLGILLMNVFGFGVSRAFAKVVRVEITKRVDWLGGRPQGKAGVYELVQGSTSPI